MPRFLTFFLSILLGLGVFAPVFASAAPNAAQRADSTPDSNYVIRGVGVDIKGQAASKARDEAFLEGSRKAFDQMAEKLSEGTKITAKNAGDSDVQKLINSFEIEKEKASKDRYIATLTFRFKPEETARYFAFRGVDVLADPYNKPLATTELVAETPAPVPSQPYLVLPIMRINERSIMWEELTSWHRAWYNYLSDYPQPDLRLTDGTEEDRRSLNAQEALAGLALPLSNLARRYQVKGIIIPVLLADNAQPSSAQNLNVQVARFDAEGKMTATYTIPLYAEPDRRMLEWMQNGVASVLGIVRDGLEKQENQIAKPSTETPAYTGNTPTTQMTLTVPLNYPSEWSSARSALQSMQKLDRMDTLQLSRREATIRISYFGTRDMLEKELAASGYQLVAPATANGTLLLLPNGQTPNQPANRPLFQTIYPTAPVAPANNNPTQEGGMQ